MAHDRDIGSLKTVPRRAVGLARWIARYPIVSALGLTAVVSAFFVLLPGIDIAVSGMFSRADDFRDARDPALQTLRLVGMTATRIASFGLIAVLVLKFVAPARVAALPTRVVFFLAASMALGPGIVVNLILKEFWGRVRPVDTDLFGGRFGFRPAWMWGGECESNCSFVSGEASASFWLVALVFVVPVAWRLPTLVATLLWAGIMSANRVAFGGHYLSDVLIAWCLTLVVILAMRDTLLVRLTSEREARIDAWLSGLGRRIGGLRLASFPLKRFRLEQIVASARAFAARLHAKAERAAFLPSTVVSAEAATSNPGDNAASSPSPSRPSEKTINRI
jgi:lipid A 4'-phosphatase